MAAQPITVSDHAPTEIPQAAIAPLPPRGWEPLSIREARRKIAAWEAGGRHDSTEVRVAGWVVGWRDERDPDRVLLVQPQVFAKHDDASHHAPPDRPLPYAHIEVFALLDRVALGCALGPS